MTTHKDQILKLRSEGHSYNSIRDKLGCSKGTICFHCGENQKEKNRNRAKKFNPLQKKILRFLENIPKTEHINKNISSKINSAISKKIGDFSCIIISKYIKEYPTHMFSTKDLLDKIGDNPTCALTGRKIDLSKPSTYQLDHIIPRSKGGDNSLDNCQLLCKEANLAKHSMLQEDFIKLCQEVIKNQQTKS